MTQTPASSSYIGRFYLFCLSCWQRLHPVTTFLADPLYEPLFSSPHLLHPLTRVPYYNRVWVNAGIRRAIDLLLPTGVWRSVTQLSLPASASSQSTALLCRFRLLLTRSYPSVFSSVGCSLPLPYPLLPSLNHITFGDVRYALSSLSLRTIYSYLQSTLPPTPSIFSQRSSTDPTLWLQCAPPLCRGRESDVQWKLLHGALPTSYRLFLLRKRTTNLCPYCHVPSTCSHEYLDCSILASLLPYVRRLASSYCGVLHSLSEYLTLVPDPSTPMSFSPSSSHMMCRYLFILTKYIVYSFRLQPSVPSVSLAAAALLQRFRVSLLSRVNYEYAALARHERLDAFFRTWDPGGSRFFLDDSGVQWRPRP